MSNDTQEQELSDYESEWELEEGDDDSQQDDFDAEFSSPTPEGESVSPEGAPDESDSTTPEDTTVSPAEGDKEEDIWAGASEAQREAYRRAENAAKAEANRAKLHADRLAERGRELKTLRDENHELQAATRQPTEFEQEHEQYAVDVQAMIDAKLNQRLPPVEAKEEPDPRTVEQESYDVITSAHPDAGDVYNSSELQAMLADDPVFKHDGRPMLFSDALHSDDPNMAVAALTHFKSTSPPPASTDAPGTQSALEDMQQAESSPDKPDMRSKAQLSAKEQYDAEWEADD